MKAFTTTKASGLIVSVPEGANQVHIHTRRSGEQTLCFDYPVVWKNTDRVTLPFPCTLLGLSHELTEQDLDKIVYEYECKGIYKNYNGSRPTWYRSMQNSFNSLLLSLGLDPKENLAILINDKK